MSETDETGPTMRIVAADVTVRWGRARTLVRRGSLVSLVPGSPLEDAYGGPENTPPLDPVQAGTAAKRAGARN
jgi:hypothetical protein